MNGQRATRLRLAIRCDSRSTSRSNPSTHSLGWSRRIVQHISNLGLVLETRRQLRPVGERPSHAPSQCGVLCRGRRLRGSNSPHCFWLLAAKFVIGVAIAVWPGRGGRRPHIKLHDTSSNAGAVVSLFVCAAGVAASRSLSLGCGQSPGPKSGRPCVLVGVALRGVRPTDGLRSASTVVLGAALRHYYSEQSRSS